MLCKDQITQTGLAGDARTDITNNLKELETNYGQEKKLVENWEKFSKNIYESQTKKEPTSYKTTLKALSKLDKDEIVIEVWTAGCVGQLHLLLYQLQSQKACEGGVCVCLYVCIASEEDSDSVSSTVQQALTWQTGLKVSHTHTHPYVFSTYD